MSGKVAAPLALTDEVSPVPCAPLRPRAIIPLKGGDTVSSLVMPSFDDFLHEMGHERIAKWADDSLKDVHREIGISFDLTNPDDAKRFVSAMFALNQRTTILMLRDYHDWLTSKLAQRSVRLL